MSGDLTLHVDPTWRAARGDKACCSCDGAENKNRGTSPIIPLFLEASAYGDVAARGGRAPPLPPQWLDGAIAVLALFSLWRFARRGNSLTSRLPATTRLVLRTSWRAAEDNRLSALRDAALHLRRLQLWLIPRRFNQSANALVRHAAQGLSSLPGDDARLRSKAPP
jgi:hypothetical protein